MGAKLGTILRMTIQRLNKERSSEMFVGGFNFMIASIVCKDMSNLLSRITWPR